MLGLVAFNILVHGIVCCFRLRDSKFVFGSHSKFDPAWFATHGQFRSATAYHHNILRHIKALKERYHNEILKMHYKAGEMRTWVQLNNTIFNTIYQHLISSFIEA
ncbi:hypothetical protein Hanom_Chr06g00500571 [Helianthus anomalus]